MRFIERTKVAFKNIKADIGGPLPESEQLTPTQKIKARFRLLYKKYGWKILAAIIGYYLVRDVALYIVIPYLIARGLIN